MTSMDSALSPQEFDNSTTNGSAKKKALLVRSNALCGDDDTKSLRPQLQGSGQAIGTTNSMPAMGVGGNRMRTKHYSNTSSLSRDSSTLAATAGDFTDSKGVYLLQFIDSTLHKNAKDREMLLNLEVDMRKFVMDSSKQAYKFPKMSSYNRMLVHRVAAFFGLDHNIDQTGTVVVVNKTPGTRLPEVEFRNLIKNNLYTDRMLQNRKNVQSFDESPIGSLYGNFHPTALANLQQQQPFAAHNYGNDTLECSVGGGPNHPPLSSSLDMIRRARSFEVGEWQNSMAVMGGGAGGMGAPGMMPLSNSSSRHHRLSGGSSNSTCSGVNWQQQFPSPGLEGLGFVAGHPYAAPPPQLLQQSSYSSSRPASLASLQSRMGGRFESGECVLDQQHQPGFSQVRSRQVSSNSSSQPMISSPITSQLATLPPISPNNHIKQSQDSGFEGGSLLLKGSSVEASLTEESSMMIDSSGQMLQNHLGAPPRPTYQGMLPHNYGLDMHPQYVPRANMSYVSPAPQYGPLAPNYSYAYAPVPGYPSVMYVPTSRGYVQVIGSPQYYSPELPAAGATYPQHITDYGTEQEKQSIHQLADHYHQVMNISSDSGTQCSPLPHSTNRQIFSPCQPQHASAPTPANGFSEGDAAPCFERTSANTQTVDSTTLSTTTTTN